ncbi:hypothetical protein HAX54_029456, partial [Datura stramonium]|nr:hypothetical protein [Datura stramonium]
KMLIYDVSKYCELYVGVYLWQCGDDDYLLLIDRVLQNPIWEKLASATALTPRCICALRNCSSMSRRWKVQ